VAHGDPEALDRAVRRDQKASDALWQLLLGILDKATLTLGDNRRVDFSNCLIFMTFNLGAQEMSALINGGMGFAQKAWAADSRLDNKIENCTVVQPVANSLPNL
jgi:ATP-dependent Clp protease ATP-binding subunit ClpA